MTTLISGNVDCQPVLTLNLYCINFSRVEFYVGILMLLALMCKSIAFLVLHGSVLTHAW